MPDPLDMEIASEIDKISKDIKSIIQKVETLYPKEKKTLEIEEDNNSQEKPNH